LANFKFVNNPSAYQLDFIERLKARRKVEDQEAQEEGEESSSVDAIFVWIVWCQR
jgi:hypothetical protein